MSTIQNLLVRVKNNFIQLYKLINIPPIVKKQLVPGSYKYNSTCTMLYNIRYASEAYCLEENLFGANCSAFNIFRAIFSKIFRAFVHGTQREKFQILVISTSGKEFKLFDVDHALLATYYKDRNRMERIAINREKWSEHFSTIPFSVDTENQFIYEQMIQKKITSEEKIFGRILDDYIRYFSAVNYDNNLEFEPDELRKFFCKINRMRDYQMVLNYMTNTDKIKICVVHGDLWMSNIIYTEDNLYYVDFEMLGKRIFYYDILQFMVSEYSILHNSTLLENFANGEYDPEFHELFNAAGLDYEPEMKVIYMEVFSYFLYREKWAGTEYEDNIDILKNCLEVFCSYEKNR